MRKQDRLIFEDMRQKVNLLEKRLEDLKREIKNQELEIAYLRSLVDEVRSKRPKGKLKAVQVPENKAEEVKREREKKRNLESGLPG